MNLYAPPNLSHGARRPAIFFVHGGPIPADMTPPTQWGIFDSYGGFAAASGMVGVVFNHRLHGPTDYRKSQDDIAAAIAHVRAHADDFNVDPERIALWAFSGGGVQLSWALRERPSHVRCLLAFYAVLDVRHAVPPNADPGMVKQYELLSPAAYLREKSEGLPMFVARAGLDSPTINQSIDTFVSEALAANATLDLANHPRGHHVFDCLDDDDRSREIIARAMDFARIHLGGS
jgi:acetyl esterase/lipase